jgi:hypothetical protein
MTKVARGNERQKKVDKKAQLKRLIAFLFFKKIVVVF